MKRLLCSLKNFFSDIFIIFPKKDSVDFSKDIIFFRKFRHQNPSLILEEKLFRVPVVCFVCR